MCDWSCVAPPCPWARAPRAHRLVSMRQSAICWPSKNSSVARARSAEDIEPMAGGSGTMPVVMRRKRCSPAGAGVTKGHRFVHPTVGRRRTPYPCSGSRSCPPASGRFPRRWMKPWAGAPHQDEIVPRLISRSPRDRYNAGMCLLRTDCAMSSPAEARPKCNSRATAMKQRN
jgi:hypothetical protein